MNLIVDLAGVQIGLDLMGEAGKTAPFCEHYFKGFLRDRGEITARVEVRRPRRPAQVRPLPEKGEGTIFEKRLRTSEVMAWLEQSRLPLGDFHPHEGMISALSQDGLLLFDPDKTAGLILLLGEDKTWIRPLFRLLWMAFAQVIAEAGGCFVHAIGLERHGKGFLFFGESGAGKSTLASRCREGRVLADDGPIVKEDASGIALFFSPYHQPEHKNALKRGEEARGAPLKGIYFLVQDQRPDLEEVPRRIAISKIMNRHIHFFPYLSGRSKKVLFDLFYKVCHNFQAYDLHLSRRSEIWDLIPD